MTVNTYREEEINLSQLPHLARSAFDHYANGNLSQAARLCETILAYDPQNFNILHLHGVLQLQSGHYDAAVALLEQATSRHPHDPASFNTLGEAYRYLEQHVQAETCYLRAVALDSSYGAAYSNLGISYLTQGRCNDAEHAFHNALRINPADSSLRTNLGRVYARTGQHAKAEEAYRHALSLDAACCITLLPLGELLQETGRYEEAEQAYQQAIRFQPDFVPAYLNLATIYGLQGRRDELANMYRQTLLHVTDSAELHNNLGVVLRDLGQQEEAEQAYRLALAINPDYAVAHTNLAIVLRDLGRLEEAEQACRTAITRVPDTIGAWCNLGILLKEAGKTADAEQAYREALRHAPRSAEVLCNLGVLLHSEHRRDEAELVYRQALEIRPDYVEASCNLGLLLLDSGRHDEAIPCFRQAVRQDPENAIAAHILTAITGAPSDSAPKEYVVALFDGYAGNFDHHLTQTLKYGIPAELVSLTVRHITSNFPRKLRVLDAGCGTGLVGELIAPHSSYLVGVDLSARMLEAARKKQLYQQLEQDDLVSMMRKRTGEHFDVITAADVFIYVGDLNPVFRHAGNLLNEGGLFAFSVEALDHAENAETPDFKLMPTARYAHSSPYIRQLAQRYGFLIREFNPTSTRLEQGIAVPGYTVVLRKN